jgi:proline iminopeptidase
MRARHRKFDPVCGGQPNVPDLTTDLGRDADRTFSTPTASGWRRSCSARRIRAAHPSETATLISLDSTDPRLGQGTHEVTLDGTRLVYHVAGRGPVLIAHSGGPGLDFSYLRSPELEQNFTVVYLEPAGTGPSGRLARSGYRLDTYVRFLTALIDHLRQDRVFLLGHSHGGFVALRYALDHPERLAGLALYDTSPMTGPDFWSTAMARLEAYPQRYPDQPRAADVPAAFRRAATATDDETFTAGLRAALPVYLADFWTRRAEFAWLERGLSGWVTPATAQDPTPFDVRDRLGEIAVPTVVIVGRHDFICGPRFAVLLHRGIARSELFVLEHSGHLGHLEQPAEFARAVTAGLIRGLTPTAPLDALESDLPAGEPLTPDQGLLGDFGCVVAS